MATFLEGVESITLACSLIVIAPTVVLILIARNGRVWIAGGAVVGTSMMMWARAGRLWEVDAFGGARWLVGAAIALIFLSAFRNGGASTGMSAALGLAGGLVTGWLWQPCVGEHFAEVLNKAETDRLESLLKMHVYVIGVVLPALLVAATHHAVPAMSRWLHHRVVRGTALVLAAAYAVTVVAGWYDDLVGELFRISST